jgi:HD-GYP domain-containing protein (c-di-GMP phosphodiesterase class II)
MYFNGALFGFVFFNSYRRQAFSADQFPLLELYGQLVSLTVTNQLAVIHTMLAAVKIARDMTAFRDVETGAHLDRMARYARLIAGELAPRYGFSDEYVEHVFLFAPLHDIGKIATPDRILLKGNALTAQEFQLMKEHARKGREMVDAILAEFGLNTLPYVDVLRNITEFHHERLDASGYPRGLSGDRIPIEARIIAVADIFDALTSRRTYKHAWSNQEAFTLLRTLAGTKLDADCVEALIRQADKIEAIQAQFRGDEARPLPPAARDSLPGEAEEGEKSKE